MLKISLLNPDIFILGQKIRASKNNDIWRRFCAEISHVRLIQAQRLQLMKVCILGKLKLCHIVMYHYINYDKSPQG